MTHHYLRQIGALPRFWKRVIIICLDLLALVFALWAAFSLRFGIWTPPLSVKEWVVLGTAPLVAIPIFVRLGLYRAVIRYLPDRAMWTVLQATALAAVGWVVLVFLLELAGQVVIPRSVPLLYWAIATILVGGSRFLAKSLLWSGSHRSQSQPVVIYGAGDAGVQLANALRQQRTHAVVGFLDDSQNIRGRDVAGIRVFSPAYMPVLVDQYGVQEVILCIPGLSTTRRQEIVAEISSHGVRIRTLPSMGDVASGKYLISQIREIDIDELLGRSSVPADIGLLGQMIEGRSIMVTGAGGSIGSELCRLIARWAPQRLVLFEASEFALYQIERELAAIKDLAIVPVLGSITDAARVAHTIQTYGVQVLFHAAAYKHVPLVESNALEGIRNNVFGTKTVVDAAYAAGVQNFVLISSDKAVRPTNVMGATKRWAELIVGGKAREALAAGGTQCFSAVRFGNVLGSNGSVVPLFKEQIAHGGPITLTDPAMTRYFMSIHEAAELIVQAGAMSEGGDVFLLDMGEPMSIRDLAENMIRLAGLSLRSEAAPSGDIEIVVTGKRPGEKMYEELFYDDSSAQPTRHPKIMRASRDEASDHSITGELERLHSALIEHNEPEARRLLFRVIVETDGGGIARPTKLAGTV